MPRTAFYRTDKVSGRIEEITRQYAKDLLGRTHVGRVYSLLVALEQQARERECGISDQIECAYSLIEARRELTATDFTRLGLRQRRFRDLGNEELATLRFALIRAHDTVEKSTNHLAAELMRLFQEVDREGVFRQLEQRSLRREARKGNEDASDTVS